MINTMEEGYAKEELARMMTGRMIAWNIFQFFKVEGATDLFYGVGAGILSKDSKKGTAFRFFSGSEFFPLSSPNIGFSLELGVQRKQGIGDVTQSFYNAIAARYYF